MYRKIIEGSPLEVRPASSEKDLRQIEQIQHEAWGLLGEDVVGKDALEVISRRGILLGAYTQDKSLISSHGGDMLGYILGLDSGDTALLDELVKGGIAVPGHLMKPISEYAGKPAGVHYMHMVATRCDMKAHSIGELLQKADGEAVRQRGIPLMEWTYDPLLSINANLFIHKTGGVVDSPERYLEDAYGQNVSGMYKSIPSDRFLAKWVVADGMRNLGASRRYGDYLADGAAGITKTEPCVMKDEAGNSEILRTVHMIDTTREERLLLMEIPSNYNSPVVIASDSAHNNYERMKWRLESRNALQRYLGEGYSVEDLVTAACAPEEGTRRAYYVLRR